MKSIHLWAFAACMTVGHVAVMAQGGAGPGTGPGSGSAGPGTGMGSGMGSGMGPAVRWGDDYTPGWSMMTAAERQTHQDRMRAMKTYEECKAYADQHREQMNKRASEQGGKALAQNRRDPCAGLPR